MTDDKWLFFEKYKDCGSKVVIEIIWKAKEAKDIYLDVSDRKIKDLSPLRDMNSLQKLDVCNTQVHDLSPLRDMNSPLAGGVR